MKNVTIRIPAALREFAGGMAELEQATRRSLAGEDPGCSVFKHPIAFNLIPHIDSFQENQYS